MATKSYREFPQSGADGDIILTYHGSIAVVKMKRGENRMNTQFFSKMNSVLDEVERNDQCIALITVGDGKFYSNGLDLDWVVNAVGGDIDLGHHFRLEFNNFIARILTFPLPTVAAVNGHAFAGGAILALAHDYMVMRSDRGFWCLSEISLGLHMPLFPLESIRAKLPNALVLTQAMLNGKRYTSQEACEAGFCSRSCDGKVLMDCAVQLVKRVCGEKGFNREIMSQMKRNIYAKALQCINLKDSLMPKL